MMLRHDRLVLRYAATMQSDLASSAKTNTNSQKHQLRVPNIFNKQNANLFDEAPPSLNAAEGWANDVAGVGLLVNEGRSIDLQYFSVQQGELICLVLLEILI